MRPALLLLLLACSAARAAAPFVPNEALRFDAAPAELTRDCVDAQKRAKSALAQIASLPATVRTFDNTPWALDRALFDLADQTASAVFLEQVSASSSTREAAGACAALLAPFDAETYGREDLYKAMTDYAARKEPLKGEDARLLDKTLLDFRRAGLGLPARTRAEVAALRATLAGLQADFLKNLDDSKGEATLTRAQLDGVPADVVSRLERDGDAYRVGLDYPTYLAVMRDARDPEARRRLEARFDDRAARPNLPIFRETLGLRLKAARLLGYATHADYAVETGMARNAATVNAFLERLRGDLAPLGRKELEVLLALKRAMEGRASDGVLHAWDWPYYDRLLAKTKYPTDREGAREYFPADLVVERTLRIYQKLLGVRFREVPDAVSWHPDAKLYEIADAAGGAPIGYFYLDLFPREGKSPRAAAVGLIAARRLTDGAPQRPVSALVAAFDKPAAGRPSLLSPDDVETFFRELGRVMQQTLARPKYGRFSGARVARDFADAPPQALADFAWDPETLVSLSGHYKDRSKRLPRETFDALLAARGADAGLVNLRQLSFGVVDMAYHGRRPPSDTTKLYAHVSADVGLVPLPEGVHPEAGFDHLMDGYDAGYYAYLWSRVRAEDMFGAFKAAGGADPIVGRRFRAEILAPAASRDEIDSLRAFLGREPSERAFLESVGLAAP